MKGNINLTYLLSLSIVAALGGFLFGYDTAVISGTVQFVSAYFQLDAVQQGWYVGCALVGSIIGVLFSGILCDRFGRKTTMFFSSIMFSISAIGCAFYTSFDELVAYRIIGGVGIGIVSIASPLYIAELAVSQYRGRLVSLYQLAITVGILCSYWVNYEILEYSKVCYVSLEWIQRIFVDEVWRGMLGMETIPALLFFVVVLLIPESPRFLLLKKRENKASEILERIYLYPQEVSIQLKSIKSALIETNDSEWKSLFQRGIFRTVIIGVSLAMLGQFMGINAVLLYGPSMFEEAGLSGNSSLFCQILVGVVNALTTILALLIIDKVGRKTLIYYGVSGMIIFLLLISFYYQYSGILHMSSWILLLGFLGYIFCCAISICAVIFVLLSEMYPMKVRGMAMSIAGFSLWIGTYLIGQLTPWFLENLESAGTFLLFAFMCIPYLLIVWKLIPETMGKSLEEIENYWKKYS